MTSVLIFAGAMASTVALLALGLAVGYRFGLQSGARIVQQVAPLPPPRESLDQYRICREVTQAIYERSEVVSNISRAHRGQLPAELQQALDQLLDATRVLGKQLERIGMAADISQPKANSAESVGIQATPAERTTPRQEATTLVGQQMRLTGAEIHSLTTLAGDPSDQEEDVQRRRYNYDCRQTVHFWQDDDPNGPISPGVTVRCHDIAVQGISFFWPDTPDFERLIIALGNGDKPTYMAADVVQSKAVFMHGEAGFLVGCRFAGRVPEFTEQGRLQLNGRRTRSAAPALATASC
jgi:hypothetical protein